MDDMRIGRSVVIPMREIRFRFSRSGGAGGQNVNKRDTRVELIFDLAGSPSLGPRRKARAAAALASRLDDGGVLRIVCSEERTQAANRALALSRFHTLMERALRPPPPPRIPTKPSRAAKARRVEEKRARGRIKKSRRARPDDD